MRIVYGKRRWAWLRLGLAIWAGVWTAGGRVAAQGARRAGVSHLASPKAGASVSAATSEALAQIAAEASVVFAGHVEAVTREDAAGFVDVRFRIDEALRGCPKTGVYVLREWAGLWIGQAERYRTGERLLMLLPARGPSGMSAPLGGRDGAIPLVSLGAEPLVTGTGVAPADDGLGADAGSSVGVDLRWIAARGARGSVPTSSGPLRAVAGGAKGRPVQPTPGDPAVEGWSGPVAPLAPSGSGSTPAAMRPSLSAVFAILRGASDAAR